MPAPGHYLRHGLSVFHPLGLPFTDNELLFPGLGCFSPGPMLFYQTVLLIKDFPAVAYPDLVYGLRHELLDMEAVVDKPGCRETSSYRQHHGCRQVGSHCLYRAASFDANPLQHLAYRICGHTPYHCHKTAFPSVSGLVGKNRIDLPVAQACLVKAEVFPYILRENDIFLGMGLLVPTAVVAYLLLVLLTKRLAVETEPLPEALYAYRTALNLPLLKKPRTPH